jgi:hypothetical protein
MKRPWITYIFVASAIGLGTGIALAQSPNGRVVGQVIGDFNDRNASGLFADDTEVLTGPEMMERSQKAIAGMNATLAETTAMWERARTGERDLVKVNCLNEKLAAIKGFLKVSEQSYVTLSDSVARRDDEASKHHYRLIAIAGQRVDVLGEEGRVCSGDEMRFAGDTLLETVVDPSISSPEEAFLGEDDLVLERLTKMSPYY